MSLSDTANTSSLHRSNMEGGNEAGHVSSDKISVKSLKGLSALWTACRTSLSCYLRKGCCFYHQTEHVWLLVLSTITSLNPSRESSLVHPKHSFSHLSFKYCISLQGTRGIRCQSGGPISSWLMCSFLIASTTCTYICVGIYPQIKDNYFRGNWLFCRR